VWIIPSTRDNKFFNMQKNKLKNKFKKIQSDNWAEDFVFPVSINKEKLDNSPPSPKLRRAGKIKSKINFTNQKHNLSNHLLDLKHPNKNLLKLEFQEKEPLHNLPNFSTPNFNTEDWFSNFVQEKKRKQDTQQIDQQPKIDFESPDESDGIIEKIKYYKPEKQKIKSKIKLDLTQNFLELETKKSQIIQTDFSDLTLAQKIFKVIKVNLNLIWQIITFPFRVLDFIVDRSLKSIWWLIKNTTLAFFNLAKSFILNLKTFILFFKKSKFAKVPIPISTQSAFKKIKIKINFKPILSFALVCLIIVLPLQILNLKQKTNQIKGQVLGKSIQGLDLLKDASILTKDLDFNEANEYFEQAYFNFKIARNYLSNLGIFSKQIIKIIPEAQQAENLLLIGQISAELGQDISKLSEELEKINSNTNSENKLSEKIKLTSEKLKQIEPQILELLNKADKIDVDILSKYIDEENIEKLILFKSSLPALKNYINKLKTLNIFLDSFLGQNKIMRYLIIFQNNSEIRPTGGFMGSYALIEIQNAKIINLKIPGGGFYDLKASTKMQVEAPKQLQHFSPDWKIWDANWFADWEASAKKISLFYEDTLGGTTLDGIITLTPDLIKDLLKITGPIEMPNYEKTISQENFTKEIQMAVEYEYNKEKNKPKQIIADLMPKLLEKIFNLKIDQTPTFAQTIFNNLSNKNILLWFKNNEMQKVANEFSWSGKIAQTQGDYLAIFHASLAGGKTDKVIKNQISHFVEINSNGDLIDTVSLKRKHNGDLNDIFEKAENVDYIKFYVPKNSKLISANGFEIKPSFLVKAAADNQINLTEDVDLKNIEKNPILNEEFNVRITEEFDKTVFAGWLSLKPNESKEIILKYKLPFKLEKNDENFFEKIFGFLNFNNQKNNLQYNLIVQKQPGLSLTDFTSQITLPADFEIIDHKAKNKLNKSGQKIIYQDNLETDGYYLIKMQ